MSLEEELLSLEGQFQLSLEEEEEEECSSLEDQSHMSLEEELLSLEGQFQSSLEEEELSAWSLRILIVCAEDDCGLLELLFEEETRDDEDFHDDEELRDDDDLEEDEELRRGANAAPLLMR